MVVWWASLVLHKREEDWRAGRLVSCLYASCSSAYLLHKPNSWRSSTWLVRANSRDSPNKLVNKKIWHLIGQLVHLGQPHNIGDNVEQSDWAALNPGCSKYNSHIGMIPDPSSSLLRRGWSARLKEMVCGFFFLFGIFFNGWIIMHEVYQTLNKLRRNCLEILPYEV